MRPATGTNRAARIKRGLKGISVLPEHPTPEQIQAFNRSNGGVNRSGTIPSQDNLAQPQAEAGRIYPATSQQPLGKKYIPDKLGAKAVTQHMASACESGHWVEDVMSDGEIVKLEDGSLWEMSGGDEITSALWLPTDEIVVCDGKLINTDDSESVEAARIR